MGLPLARLAVVCLALSLAMAGQIREEGRARNHGHNVCSTWGDFHYKTFDGAVFRFAGLCDYNFASDCRDSYKEFAVHLQRGPAQAGGVSQITSVLLTIKDDVIYLTHQLVVVNGAMVGTPHYSSGLLIEKNEAYTKVYSRAGLSLMWNREDSLMLELDSKFQNHTCGLCGDYNGQQTSEFLSDGISLSATEFGNRQKINNPQTQCEDPEEVLAPESCSEHRAECERLLTAAAFEDCQARLPLGLYLDACVQDLCSCGSDASCACGTISEFSRQCSHAGGRPGSWRTASLCPKSCPGNMVYLESGSPCVDTCSHLEVSSLCEEHPMDGCFCPEGTVYDDVGGSGCIPVSQCHCKLHGRLYSPGQKITNDCEDCVCNAGRWVCKDLPCPGTCALEGGSHITTFDGKKFTFHGDCYYVLSKGDHNDSHALLGELAPCGSSDKQTCLKSVVLVTDRKKDVVAFKADGRVLLNELEVHLPHVTASFSIFQPSSHHIIVDTAFGLRLQIQLVPVMQLFVTRDQASQGQVQGLCGNFNGLESDDFRTASGLVEATGAGFANTWKAQSSCHDKLDWLDDPCSLNIESANYAEHWCSLLKKTETPFSKCHSAVDPSEYYKRCKYDTCNCANNEDCLCAALSSYAHACAAKGVMLWGWRERVCNKEAASCPSSQVFLYNLTTCQQTCRSLSEANSHCLEGFAPVDGCGCPDRTFLDEKGRCVPVAKCSCYHNGLYLEAGDVVLRQEERCICRNGRLYCTQVKLLGQSCAAPKILVDCNNLTALSTLRPRPLSCQTLAASYYHTGCVSGCVCPEGLIDDGRGGCVEEEDCPCLHHKDLYSPGSKIKVDCNTCTCQRGRWVCTQSLCHGTCSIYGSGHYVTFDGKYYDFDGQCSYVAVQDYCGQNSSGGSFSIITENVPCGTTGVTCSKAIKIFLGGTELKLEEKHRRVVQLAGRHVAYTTREVGQYLVVEASTGVIVIWDKKTTLFIKLAPSYKGTVCGLCGNFDDRSNNDFTTRDHLVVSSELDFGNSWKEAPTCPDVSSTPEPCSLNPHRRSWAEKQCSLIKSSVFSACHSKVDPTVFYEACVHDSCSCDTGGDCECFCSAVASYAQECTKAGACVFWRTPDLCPVFCDYYNPPDECEWHYEPCGNRSYETCRTVNGIHSNISVSYLEGCYPRCPRDRPIYDEDLRKCVREDQCGCYIEDTRYPPGASVPTDEICKTCVCTESSQVECRPEEGKVLNQTQDGAFCYKEVCGPNGTVEQHFDICTTITPTLPTQTASTTTTLTPSTPLTTTSTSTSTSTSTGTALGRAPHPGRPCCFWTDWINEDHPSSGDDGGDRETFDAVCAAPENIECRSATEPHLSWEQLGQKVVCDISHGFICKNEDQFDTGLFELCYDYEIRVNCCVPEACTTPTKPPPTTTTTTLTTTTTSPSTVPTTTPSAPPPTPTTPPTTTATTTPTTTSPSTVPTTTPSAPPPTPTTPPTTTATTPPTTTSTATPPTTTSSPPSPSPTPCVLECEWTGWLDSGKTDYDKEGGDVESIEGVCAPDWVVNNITCRAAMFPSMPLEELGQTVVCNLKDGLVCRNKDQKPGGRPFPMPYCLNYEINVQCCRCTPSTSTPSTTPTTTTTTQTTTPTPTTTTLPPSTPTPTTTPTPSTTVSPTTTPSTPTPTTTTTGTPTPTPTTTTTETPTPTPTTTITQTTTTATVSPTTTTLPTTSTTPTTTPCFPECEWTGWLDSGKPDYDKEGGDVESIEGVCAPGRKVNDTSCRAAMFPSMPLEELGQTVTCNADVGLVCRNKDQKPGGRPFPMPYCLNYEINVQCCGCPPTTPSPTTTTTTQTTTPTPSTTVSPTTIPSTPTPTTTTTETPTPTPKTTTTATESPTTTPSTSTPLTTTSSPTTTTIPTISLTTPCFPGCKWSGWLDSGKPDYDKEGGDVESIEGVCAPGWVVNDTSCRAAMFPSMPLEELGQTVTCNADVGLVCRNKDQKPGGRPFPMPYCLNYEINVQCCDLICSSTTTFTTTTTTETTTPTPTTTTTQTTSTQTTTPTPETTPTPSTPTPTTTTTQTTTQTPRTTTPTVSTPTPTTTTTRTPTPAPTTTTTQTATPTPETPTQTPSTLTPTTTTRTTTTVSPTTTTLTPTVCVQECEWSGWLDSGKTDYDKEGGDVESIEGVCAPGLEANNITCRAAMFPSMPLEELGQTVVCNLNDGLVCKNKDQKPGGRPFPMPYCLNYEINVQCCGCPPTTPSPTTTTTTQTTTPTPSTTVSPTTIPSTPTPTTTTTTQTTTPTPTTTTTTQTITPTPKTSTLPASTPIPTTTTQTTTPTSTTTTPTPPTRTPTATTTETPTPTPTTTTPTPTTTTQTPSTVSSTTTTLTPTVCVQECEWSGWLDSGKPDYDKEGGDVESIEGVCAPGWVVNDTSCRAAMFPSMPLEELGQTVTCNADVGLVCRNKDQKPGGRPFPMPYCLNYEINVQCCVQTCSSTTFTTTTTTTTETSTPTPKTTPTPSTTTPETTTTQTTTPTPTTTTTQTITPTPETSTLPPSTPTPTTTTQTTTPTSTTTTPTPPTTTPTAITTETPTPTPTTTTETPNPTPTTTTPTPSTTVSRTTTPSTTTPTTTTIETLTPTPKTITTATESPTTTLSPTTSTVPSPTPCFLECEWTGWLDSGKPDYDKEGGDVESIEGVCAPGRKVNDTSCRAAMFPSMPLEELGQTVTCNADVGLVCRNKDQKPGGRPFPMPYCLNYEINVQCCDLICSSTTTFTTTTTTTTPTSEITTTATESPTTTPSPTTSATPSTTPCFPECKWTGWLDSGKPDYDKEGGDVESIEGVCAPGWVVNDTSCRAAMFPSMPLEELGQTVTCNESVGLVCRNKDQKPGGRPFPMPYCLNYEINVQCCVQTCSSTTFTTTTTTPTPGTTTPTPPTPAPTTTTTTQTTTPTPGTTSPTPGTSTPTPPTPAPTTTTTETTTPTPGTTSPTPGTSTPTPPTPAPITTTTTTQTTTPTPGTTSPTPGTSTPTPSPPTSTTTTQTTTPIPGTTTPIPSTPTPSTTVSPTPTPTTMTTTTTTTEIPPPPSTTTESPTITPSTTTTTTSTTTTETSTPTSPVTQTPTITTTTTTTTPAPTTTESPTTTPSTTTTTTESSTPAPSPTPTNTQPGSSTLPTPPSTPTPPTAPSTPTGSTLSTSTAPPGTSTSGTTPTPATVPTTTRGTPTQTRPPTTPSTLETTSTSSTVTPISSPTTVFNTSLGTVSSSTLVTCCVVNDTNTLIYYAPGEEVYSGRHGDTCYYVNCSVECTLQTFNWSCPSSPSPTSTPSPSTPSSPATTTSTSTSTPTPFPPTTTTTPSPTTTTPSPSTPTAKTTSTTTSKPTTTKPPGCQNLNPPREDNESWWLCNCTKAVCREDGTLEIVEVECEPPPMPTCSNGLKPVRVLDPDGCCWHWECDCLCTGWGDPHYVTFDGLYYSYQGNCTYVLVEEVVPTVDNFGVYIDNYHCDVNDKVSCPRTLIVRHETQEVQIRTVQMLPIKVQVQVNRQMVALPYRKFGMQVYESGINIVVDIPELGVVVSYNGLAFSVQLPYRLFGNNTKGQCGTCTNNTADDCVLPSGEVTPNCEIAADQWVVDDPSKPHCPHGGFTTQSPAATSPRAPARPKDCTGSPVCQLIKDSLFAGCHALVPPQHYYEACLYDTCFVPDSNMECASLQAYAALCAQEGFCVDWRPHSKGACPVKCPSHREYRACGPPEEPTCQSSTPKNSTRLVEGCFCPEGTMNFAPGYDVCVKTCGCVGPDNVPREFGERFEFACQDCVCLEGGSGIICEPRQCGQAGPTSCEEEGTYLTTEVNPADTCCNVTSCKCDSSLCSKEVPVCDLGFEAKLRIVSGRCCPVYDCVPKGVCVHDKAEYQPGSPVYSSKCQDCLCTHAVDNSTQLNAISCTPVPCNVSCNPGFEAVEVPGECCRKCQQTQCIIDVPGGNYLVLKPGDVQQDPNNKCTFFSCTKFHGQLISSLSNVTCPEFDPNSCAPGTITLMANGCCKKCTPRNQTVVPCAAVAVTREISHAGCRKNVTVNDCSGACGTFAKYSGKAKILDSRCSCCREERTSRRQVALDCPNGGSLTYTYTHIESCLCQDSICELPTGTALRARRSPRHGRPGRSRRRRKGTGAGRPGMKKRLRTAPRRCRKSRGIHTKLQELMGYKLGIREPSAAL
ncbi:mucin-2 [Lepus europaeus]|uniref:mucin-2 n=1 Tax=Lepus europaeus TaxID=9983 RepID=UPI002B45C36E|nr:mucin-2 [Lepus europaeus]